ncbi:MAG: peptidoglycan-binding domain-containing protein [Verrucomicrobiota bacterium]
MKTKLTLIAGLAAATALWVTPAISEAGSCGSRSGISISFSSGGSSFHHGSSFHRSYSHRYYTPHRYSSYRSYCPTTYRRTITHYRPTTRYVSAPAQRISVADVQYVLKSRGYNVGRVDGRLGNQTKFAIKRFQRDVGLHPCGTLTSATLRALGF